MARNFARTGYEAGQSIDCGNSAALNPANNFSLACWVRFSTFPTDNAGAYVAQFLISRDDANTQRSYSLLLVDYQGTANTMDFAVFSNSSTLSECQDTTAVAINTWYHFVATYQYVTNGTSILRLYKNGALVRTVTNGVGPCVSTTATNYFGRRSGAPIFPLHGQLAECAIYTRTLGASDAVSLAKGASPPMVRPDGLVMYAPLVRDIMDSRGTATLTNNSTTATNHPRVYT